MVVTAAIIAAGTIVAGVGAAAISSSASRSAARTQAQAAQTAAEAQVQAQEIAIEEQRRQYNLSREDFAPYRETGTEALGTLRQLNQPGSSLAEEFHYPLSAFQADPGFQFRLDEGMKVLERSAAARGGVLGGRQLKDITRFGQEFASNEYNTAYTRAFNEFMANRGTRFNRLAALAGIGQTTTSFGAQIGAQTSGNISNIYQGTGARLSDIALQSGNARAAGQIGAVSPYASLLWNIGQLGLQYYGMQQYGASAGGAAGGAAGTVTPPPVPLAGG